jgi:hypothetical protein
VDLEGSGCGVGVVEAPRMQGAFEVKAECKAVWLRRKANTLEKTPSPASTDLRSIVHSTIIIL